MTVSACVTEHDVAINCPFCICLYLGQILRAIVPQSPVVLEHVILIIICIFQVAREITIRLRFLTFQGSQASSFMGWYTSLTTCSLAGNTRLFSLCMEAHRFVDTFSLLWVCDVIMFLCPQNVAVYGALG